MNDKKDKYLEKVTINCKFCDYRIVNPSLYPGKKLMVNRYCPKCHNVNPFPLLDEQDKKYLRLGFFSNPLYPLLPNPLSGKTRNMGALFYPLSLFVNFTFNILYMPFGLIANNISIAKANKLFYENSSDLTIETIYYNMLRKKALEGLSYANFILGKAYLEGERYPYNLEIALEYLNVAKEDYEEQIILYCRESLSSSPKYDEIVALLKLVSHNPFASYYLAYIYYFGYCSSGVSLRNAKSYASVAFKADVKDRFLIYEKLNLTK